MNLSALKNIKNNRNSGFTLIELLVVIGILGILAAALVATIDPFEQLKKADDTNIKNVTVEFSNALLRYYTTHSAMPWGDNTTCSTQIGSGANLTSATTCLSLLVADGELKPTFTTATNILQHIMVSGVSSTSVACFQPKSKSQQRDKNTVYTNSTGTLDTTTTCAGNGGTTTTCYWCAKN